MSRLKHIDSYLIIYISLFLFVTIHNVYTLTCPANTWPCNNGIQCINSTSKCNSIVDCSDGSDEGLLTCSKSIILFT